MTGSIAVREPPTRTADSVGERLPRFVRERPAKHYTKPNGDPITLDDLLKGGEVYDQEGQPCGFVAHGLGFSWMHLSSEHVLDLN